MSWLHTHLNLAFTVYSFIGWSWLFSSPPNSASRISTAESAECPWSKPVELDVAIAWNYRHFCTNDKIFWNKLSILIRKQKIYLILNNLINHVVLNRWWLWSGWRRRWGLVVIWQNDHLPARPKVVGDVVLKISFISTFGFFCLQIFFY